MYVCHTNSSLNYFLLFRKNIGRKKSIAISQSVEIVKKYFSSIFSPFGYQININGLLGKRMFFLLIYVM